MNASANGSAKARVAGSRDKPPRIDVEPENIPAEMLRLDRWLGWRWEWKPEADGGRGKWTKPPINVLDDRLGSSTDPEQWCDFQTCFEASEAGRTDGVGFALGDVSDGQAIVGVDLDDCRNPATGELTPEAETIIRRIGGYWEVSPSGTGCKGLFYGVKPKGKCKRGDFEIYGSGRYFTVTGRVLPGCVRELIDATLGLGWFHETFIDPPKPSPQSTAGATDDATRAVELLEALSASRADNYEDWLLAGMALKSVSPDLFSIWDGWSQRSAKYNAEECRRKWDSFNGSGVGIGSLYHWATKDGWKPARRERVFIGDRWVDAESPEAKAWAPSKVPLEIVDVCEFTAQHPTLQPPVIEGVVRAGETFNLNGDTKSCKSWLFLNLALTIATGGVWLGRHRCRRGKVFYCDNELPKGVLAFRVREVAASMGLFPDNYRGWIDVVSLRGRLRSFNELLVDLADVPHGKYAAMLFDARYRFRTDDADENSNDYQIAFFNSADVLAERTGATIGFVHHASKGNQGEKKVSDVGAGGGAQSRAPDAHLALRPHEDEGIYVLDGVLRSFAPLSPLPIRWAYPLWTPELDADPEKLKGRLTGNEQRTGDRDREGMETVVRLLLPGPATVNELIRRGIGMGRPRAEKLLGKLHADGQVTIEDTEIQGNKATVYKLVEEGVF